MTDPAPVLWMALMPGLTARILREEIEAMGINPKRESLAAIGRARMTELHTRCAARLGLNPDCSPQRPDYRRAT